MGVSTDAEDGTQVPWELGCLWNGDEKTVAINKSTEGTVDSYEQSGNWGTYEKQQIAGRAAAAAQVPSSAANDGGCNVSLMLAVVSRSIGSGSRLLLLLIRARSCGRLPKQLLRTSRSDCRGASVLATNLRGVWSDLRKPESDAESRTRACRAGRLPCCPPLAGCLLHPGDPDEPVVEELDGDVLGGASFGNGGHEHVRLGVPVIGSVHDVVHGAPLGVGYEHAPADRGMQRQFREVRPEELTALSVVRDVFPSFTAAEP